jgi:putative addiction module CopG family antidote
MNISITPELERFLRAKIDSGMYESPSEVFREALRLLAEQDELREKIDRNIEMRSNPPTRGEIIRAERLKEEIVRLNNIAGEIGSTHQDTRNDAQRGREAWRITSDAGILAGKPCIRGMRIRVADILEMLAHGASRADILADFPYLEDGDITAALDYAASAVDHRLIKAA